MHALIQPNPLVLLLTVVWETTCTLTFSLPHLGHLMSITPLVINSMIILFYHKLRNVSLK